MAGAVRAAAKPGSRHGQAPGPVPGAARADCLRSRRCGRDRHPACPTDPAQSHLSHRIPLIPLNPTCPGESHLSHLIPVHPGEIPLIPGNPIENMLVPCPTQRRAARACAFPSTAAARAPLACAARPGASRSSPRSLPVDPPRTVVRCTGAARVPGSRHAGGTPAECVPQGRQWLPLAAREPTLGCGQATAGYGPQCLAAGPFLTRCPEGSARRAVMNCSYWLPDKLSNRSF